MWLNIRGPGLKINEAVLDRIKQRLRSALGRYSDRIGRISVQLIGMNDQRGVVNKWCRVNVEFLGRGGMIVVEYGSDLDTTIDRVADRARQAVQRFFGRARLYSGSTPVNEKSTADTNCCGTRGVEAQSPNHVDWTKRPLNLVKAWLGKRIGDFRAPVNTGDLVLLGGNANWHHKQMIQEMVFAATAFRFETNKIAMD